MAHHRIRVRLLALVVRPSEVLVCGIFTVPTVAGTMYGIRVWQFCSSLLWATRNPRNSHDLHPVLSWTQLLNSFSSGWFLPFPSPFTPKFPQSACIIVRSTTLVAKLSRIVPLSNRIDAQLLCPIQLQRHTTASDLKYLLAPLQRAASLLAEREFWWDHSPTGRNDHAKIGFHTQSPPFCPVKEIEPYTYSHLFKPSWSFCRSKSKWRMVL